MRWIVLLLATAAPLSAEGCPPAPDHARESARILSDLQSAPDEMTARGLSQDLWRIWTDAPDDRAQELLDRGMAQRESYDYLGARGTFDLLVDYCPYYAEGYNQRAFASFLRQDYAAALIDLDRALALNPRHVAALSGKALTLLALGRSEDGQAALRAALALNPWLSERALLEVPAGTPL